LFYGVVLSAPLAKAGHLCLRCFVTKERRPWLAFTLGAAGPWALMVGVLFGPSFLEYLGRREFDSEAWQAVSTRRTQERIKMVDDLIDSGVLDHLPRARVAELLGDDDSDSRPPLGPPAAPHPSPVSASSSRPIDTGTTPASDHRNGITRSDTGTLPTASSRIPRVKMVSGQGVSPNGGAWG